MSTIADIRTRLRKDLHDEDSANYRWTDGELDRHIQRTAREFSLAVPLEAKTTLTTTAGSRELSIAALTDLVAIEAVEYPAGEYPPSYVRFSVWLSTLTLLTDRMPAAGRKRERLLDEAPHDRRQRLDRARALRGRHRRRRSRIRRPRVGELLDQPRERRRPRRLARVSPLGPGAPRGVPAGARALRPA